MDLMSWCLSPQLTPGPLINNRKLWGWRDRPAIKGPCCPCRGQEFNSQHLPEHSQLSVSPAPGDPVPFFGLSEHLHMDIHIYTQTHLLTCKNLIFKKQNCQGKVPLQPIYSK